MPKLSEALKDVELATRELQKEQQEWKVKRSAIKREIVMLNGQKAAMERLLAEASIELKEIQSDIALAKDTFNELRSKNTELEVENHRLEDSLDATSKELASVKEELATRTVTMDDELAAYSLEKKEAIKEDILETHRELTTAKNELAMVREQVEQQRTDLRELNQVYIDEQTDLKASSADTKRIIEENKSQIQETEGVLTDLREKLQKVQYDYDNTTIALTKAREEHEKFLAYEKEAWKKLETKDKQLQKSAADIATEGQFIKNQRSFLPPM
jgi:septal ring factor EnvC (AmiA/AmiB activator)